MIQSGRMNGQIRTNANRNHSQRRYALKRGNVFKLVGLAVTLILATLLGSGSGTMAQPIFPTASGCKESAILTTEQFLNPGTGAFTQDRTVIPGEDNQVVLGAWVVIDGWVPDPTAGAPATPNCPGYSDGNPTYVVKLVAKPVAGDPVAVGVQSVTWWYDNDVDGQITVGKDTQIGAPMPGTCLTSPEGCVLTFGNTPIFGPTGAGLADSLGFPLQACLAPGGGPSCGGIILKAELANPQPGATLQVRLEGFTADLVNLNPPFGPGAFSSDFAPQYKKAASNVRVIVQGGGEFGVLSPGVNNASGNVETGVLGTEVDGIRTRDDRGDFGGTRDRDARPADRDYIVGIIQICEGGEPVVDRVIIVPPIAAGPPTIAGAPGSTPCIAVAGTDGLPTNIVRIRVGISGSGAQYVQAVRVYADTGFLAPWGGPATNTIGVLFEPGEEVLSQIPVNGIASVGSLEQTLFTSGGTPLVLPDGAATPGLLYVTLDIDDRATESEITVQVAIDVADVPGGPPGFGPTGTSRLLRTIPQEFTVRISGPAGAPTGIAAYDTNGNGVIDDLEFFQAIRDWVDGVIDDTLFFQIVDAWVNQTRVAGLSAQSVSVALSQSAQGLTLSAGGSDVAGIGLTVYDLQGRTVFARETAGTTLNWNYLSAEGKPVANGVYLYAVTVKGANGEILRSEVRKLIVLR